VEGLRDPGDDARLLLCAKHHLAWYLNDLGHPEDALAVLNRARPLYRQFPDRRTQLRLHWLEGRIAFRLGDYTEAETIFVQLWDDFRARDLQHDLVLLSIDLAEALVAKGEHARDEDLIGQCQPILASWGLRYVLVAWLMLQQAIRERQAGAIFGQTREYYRRHWDCLPSRCLRRALL
jgi:tetratricopeptide (TPR) repeat protein